MLYRSEPPTDRQRRRLRWIGAAVLAVGVLLVVTLHARKRHHADESLAAAFDHLAAHQLDAAESAFRRQLGDLNPEPLAILGLSVIRDLRALGTSGDAEEHRAIAKENQHLSSMDRAGAEAHSLRLLAHARPAEALAFADAAQAVVGKSVALARVRIFAAHWMKARELRTAHY